MTIIPASYHDVVALLKSDTLAVIEREIASQRGLKIIYDYGAASVSFTQAEISVCGLTTVQLETYMAANRNALIDFGVRFLSDGEATSDDQEYPDGEAQDEDGQSETLGYGNGFGIKIAIYHNFLTSRSPGEFRAYLKNRRIPLHAKFAKALERIVRGG